MGIFSLPRLPYYFRGSLVVIVCMRSWGVFRLNDVCFIWIDGLVVPLGW